MLWAKENNNNNNRLYSTPDTPQAGVQQHHTGMTGAGVAPVGCQPQGPVCRQSTANPAPVVHLSQPKLVPTLLLGGQVIEFSTFCYATSITQRVKRHVVSEERR